MSDEKKNTQDADPTNPCTVYNDNQCYLETSIWIDTNVMLEIFTFGDFYREIRSAYKRVQSVPKNGEPQNPLGRAYDRLVRARGSLWMAMALCRFRETTISYEHELINNTYRIVPPGTEEALPTKALFNAFMPWGLLSGWRMRFTGEGEKLSGRGRDRLMGDRCQEHRLHLISRDGEALEYAQKAGVNATTPEDFAAPRLSQHEARAMFRARLERAALFALHDNLHTAPPAPDISPGWLAYYLRQAIMRYHELWQ